MYIQRIEFSYKGESRPEKLVNMAQGYLAALNRNGQTWGKDLPLYLERNRCITMVTTPEADSLDIKFHGKFVKKESARLEQAGIGVSSHLHAEAMDSVECCKCHDSGGYILFTAWMAEIAPVHCLDCFDPVPLYKLPVMPGSGEYNEVFGWETDYQSCDALQMQCGVLEKTATRQLAELNSRLSKNGRKICKTLSKLTGKPFYYYLYRYSGIDYALEEQRRCPSCGEHWLLDKPLHSLFDFKCDRCMLLSNIAKDFP